MRVDFAGHGPRRLGLDGQRTRWLLRISGKTDLSLDQRAALSFEEAFAACRLDCKMRGTSPGEGSPMFANALRRLVGTETGNGGIGLFCSSDLGILAVNDVLRSLTWFRVFMFATS